MSSAASPRTRNLLTMLVSVVVLTLFVSSHPGMAASQSVRRAVVYLPLIRQSSQPGSLPGRTVPVTGSLQAAVDVAQPGDRLVLQGRIYAGDISITRAGAAAKPIAIQGAGRGVTKLRGNISLRDSAAFWIIEDLDVDAGADGDAVRLSAPAHDLTLRRVHLYNGDGYGVRIGNDTSNVLIEDCEIDHFDAGEEDAHGVGIMTASDVTIRRCDIHHNSGDAVQSNTPDYPGYGRFASNILVESNQLHHNRENALDIKSTHGLLAHNNRAWGFRAVSSSDGMAIQVQYDARDIKIQNNEVWDAVEGIEVSRGSKNGTEYPAAPQRVTIARNLFRDLVAAPDGDSGNGSGIVIRASSDVQVYNNTVLRAARFGMCISTSGGDAYPRSVDVRNNVLEGALSDLTFGFDPGRIDGLTVDYNHYTNRLVNGNNIADWQGAGYDHHATGGAPLLDTMLAPTPTSPLRDSGADVGFAFSGRAPDRGWREAGPRVP